jgi:serine/threonine protein kinase
MEVPLVIAGKYRLLSTLGQGGMAVVHRAEHLETGKQVAVKLLTPGEKSPEISTWEADRELIGRFQREARAAGSLDAEHIVEVFDAGIDPDTGTPYLVMELLQGGDLQALVQERGALPAELALRLCGQALTGLAAAHEWNIVHRDVKPANLFLCQDARGAIRVKLLDFGIAKAKAGPEQPAHALTQPGSLLGTPQYMAPEQLESPGAVDARADVWSMGAVLYRCLTGETPHAGCETIGSLMAALLTRPVPSVQERAPWVSPAVAALVDRALGREPRSRYASAAVMLAAVKALCPAGLEVHARELRAPHPRREHELRGSIAPPSQRPAAPRGADPDLRAPVREIRVAREPRGGRFGYIALATLGGVAALVVGLDAARAHSSPEPTPSAPALPTAALAAVTLPSPAPPPAPEPLARPRLPRASGGPVLRSDAPPVAAPSGRQDSPFKNPALGI